MKKKSIVTFTFLVMLYVLTSSGVHAQWRRTSVWAVDFVKPREGQRHNYLKYIEANWMKAREEAKKQGIIVSYKVLVLPPSGEDDFVLLLMTEYADMKGYEAREENFKKVFAKIAPNGPTLINGLGSRQLAEITSSKIFTEPIFAYPK
jgi:hypothetical protein